MNRALKWKWLFVAMILVTLVVALQYRNSETNRQYRAKISTLSTELTAYQSDMEDLRHLLAQPRFQGLTLRQDSATEWEVETPAEFGATNWVLYLEVSNSKIVALRMRTMDSSKRRPEGAPPDKSLPGAQ